MKNIKHSARQEAISPSSAQDLCNRAEKAVSVIEPTSVEPSSREPSLVEPNNNEILKKVEQEQPSHAEENISVGDEKETEAKAEVEEVTTDESFIDVDEDEEQCKEESEEQEQEDQEKGKENVMKEEDRSGLFLLAEAAIPAGQTAQSRKIRFASTDCSGLEMLSDLADQREKAEVVGGVRLERSKSLDCSVSTELRNDIKQFVKSKSLKLSPDSLPEDKLDKMAAWELDLRIQMAEKQRKYNEINRKLLKIQKIKKKSIKKDKNRMKIKKIKKKIKYQVQNIEEKISSGEYQEAEPTPTPQTPQTQPTPPSRPTPPSPRSPSLPADPVVPEMPEKPNLPESLGISEGVEEEEDKAPSLHVVTSFSETFQKFKQSYLSRTGGDSRLSGNKAKKIPTLENWRTIMQGNRKKKENPKEENKSTEQTCFNNNLFENSTRVRTGGEKYLLHHKKRIKAELFNEEDHAKLSQSNILSKLSEAQDDQEDNNNKLATWQPEETEETFLSFKKKLKKKHKEQLTQKVVEAESTKEEGIERKKKKKKKEKKERRDREKKNRRKERKERKERKVSEDDSPPKLVAAVESSVPPGSPSDSPPSLEPEPGCLLAESDLVDGLRVLLRLGGHFYTSRLTEISPPDIYGIVVDRERGNKPHILSREEVLHQAVSNRIIHIFLNKANLLPSLSGSRCSSRQCFLTQPW